MRSIDEMYEEFNNNNRCLKYEKQEALMAEIKEELRRPQKLQELAFLAEVATAFENMHKESAEGSEAFASSVMSNSGPPFLYDTCIAEARVQRSCAFKWAQLRRRAENSAQLRERLLRLEHGNLWTSCARLSAVRRADPVLLKASMDIVRMWAKRYSDSLAVYLMEMGQMQYSSGLHQRLAESAAREQMGWEAYLEVSDDEG